MNFMESTTSLAQDPQIFGFISNPSWQTAHNFFPLLEVITFEVPDSPHTQFLIQHFYQYLQGYALFMYIGIPQILVTLRVRFS
jgi:hypothetical protein